ncbi:hypothetical protein K470DRAFT_259532 [Piedraia hortae CBS 480.64]|uniref:Uncharacterized protein n=1 Tax=Piedraia hortae CBS 480.64 TaxID=1314780 RepID=A0A6A7BUA3_9PEZI|nr:hypothetical protein K470DRAFT_259532 [Piedraia hortae CBS 480.64]
MRQPIPLTRYLTSLTTVISPSTHSGQLARLFISTLPASARGTVDLNVKVMGRAWREESTLLLGFKDGEKLEIKLGGYKTLREVEQEVGRTVRGLKRREDLVV